ncbi:glycosyltransferase family 4 protein [Opitutus sp. GAS368]|uniref:glycosyltransferase family 4 protein n=1 Tax=Opitutus sp. GAS368 TaxID=1882749 RepID=UPI00087BE870|nr:glycosyltransferase family 4 protein [Opitutus sp. GAS368]SDS64464.1 Glycosyltransferase involved in cell wall bisynthesis [Opitutus sp. GAS368]
MDKPRLILVNRVYWPSTAATAQLLTDLAEGLAARGWPVHVIAAGEASTRHKGVTIHRTGGSDRHGGLFSRLVNYGHFRREARRQLAALLQPGDVVVVMTDPPMLGAALTGLAGQRGASVVHWIQDIYPEIVSAHVGALAALPLSPLRARRDAAWRAARACVTLGEDMAQLVRERQVPADRIALVPNWAPRELHEPAATEAITARRLAWGVGDKFVIAYSGNLGRVHEFTAVLAAAERLKAQRNIVFLFIGTGARFEEIRTAAAARGLDNVRLLPPAPRAELAAALAAADVQLVTLKPAFGRLVYPSKLAGVLAAARPVLFVGPPEGEIARFLARAQCGAAVGPDDGTRLAGLIAEWRADPARCAHLGRQARAAYERHFTFDSALAAWETILHHARGK